MSDAANAAYAEDSTSAPLSEHNIKEARRALHFLCQELLNRERRVEECAKALSEAQEALADIQERKLPDMMQEIGDKKLTHVDEFDGTEYVVEYASKWAVSMPGRQHADKRAAIYSWLREIGQGGIVKKSVVIALGKQADSEVQELIADINQAWPGLSVAVEDKIEPATLTALVSRMKDAGKNINENLAVNPVREARVKER